MNSITNETTTAPQLLAADRGVVMPICAYLPLTSPVSARTTGADVRDRQGGIESVKGGTAVAHFPGDRAWRPPIC
ncbi:hypothetical protein [Nocardioides acrostichi]|uniref:Uncharacterized protein n=1 Tax=Nocardioides acrostichi TaxID=2784339 RepID=A0A930UV09_9ACTN|nr:hypothetical protein [Nocardioides acrostichi]MBF4160691.1 hypothetical protein [Nocardioides acrostichi]